MDPDSYVQLWSCDEIIAHREKSGPHVPELPLVCIGDYLIASNFFLVDIVVDAAPVRRFADDTVFAPSLASFVAGIAAGRLDHL